MSIDKYRIKMHKYINLNYISHRSIGEVVTPSE